MTQPAPIPTPTTKLGQYSIFEKLGEGGMGEVFLATREGVPCVLKTLRPEAAQDEIAVARFVREAEIGARVRHRNVASVLRSGHEDGVLTIELELVRGKDLKTIAHSLLAEERLLPYPISISALLGILDGLDHIHRLTDGDGRPLGIVHRDLSLRNLMLSYDGVPKIIDFGVARAELDDFRTKPGVVPGTLRFVSPELAKGEPVDHRSDLYAAGLVAYELLCGTPVVAPNQNPLSIIRAVIETTPVPLDVANPEIPQELAAVVMKALAKDRNQRWQSAAELKAAIERAVPTWARLEQALLSKFLRAWFKEDAERADALFDTLEAWRASGLSPWHQDDDELTAVRPMSGFEGVEEEFASTTGLRFPTRVRQATRPPSGTTPEERLLVSQAIARPRAAPRPMVWLIAGLIALSAATISVATVMLRPQRVEQIPLEGSEPTPVAAIRAALPQQEVREAPEVAASPKASASPRASASLKASASPLALAPSSAPKPPLRQPAPPTPPVARTSVEPPLATSAPAISRLAALAKELQRSSAHPLSQDPAFQAFVDEVTSRARLLPEKGRRSAMAQLDLLIDSGEVARVRPILEALEPN